MLQLGSPAGRVCSSVANVGEQTLIFCCDRFRFSPLYIGLLVLAQSCYCLNPIAAQTGTFIDRFQPTDLRVVTFNIWLNTIFPEVNPTQAAKFGRIVNSLDPDILNLQEIRSSAADVANLMDSIAPLPNGYWQVHKGGRSTVIVSKYPLSMLETTIDPTSERPPAVALVDLPDAQFASDLYLINHHYVFGSDSSKEEQRQRDSDSTIRWLQDARTPGGSVDLSPGTPFIVLGDFNSTEQPEPINTLLTGDIFDESAYGPDSAPDWDGSSLIDARPVQNGVLGADDYTFRKNDSFYDRKTFSYLFYSDSALDEANKFVLNTVDMSPAELAATGLQSFDVTIDSVGEVFDHLPVVTDFRLFNFADSDFNFDRTVDNTDLALWESNFGLGGTATDADLDGDTDGTDFLIWQRQLTVSEATTSVPEPTTLMLVLLFLAGAGGYFDPFLRYSAKRCTIEGLGEREKFHRV